MTTEEVSDMLRLPLNTLYAWHHRGKGPRAFRAGKYVRYRRADVLAWIDEQMVLDASGLDAGEQ